MPGIQPPDTTHAELTARLGPYAVASPDNDANAAAVLHLMLEERQSVSAALKTVGLSWGWLHRYRTNHPEWWQRYRDTLDTLADAYAVDAQTLLVDGIADIKESEPRLANALASVWRERSRLALTLAERTSTRWRANEPQAAQGVTNVVVMLPALAAADASATLAPAAGVTVRALAPAADVEYIVLEPSPTTDEKPQLPVER